VGVHRCVVDAHFVVKMGAGAAATFADVSDCVSAVYVLARDAGEVAKVAVARGDAVAVINDDGTSITAHEVCEYDDSIGWGYHRLAIAGSNINTAVERTLSVERVDAFAKGSRDRTFHRP
jgi:hypothetical protein